MLVKGTKFQTFYYRIGESDVFLPLKASCLANCFKSLYKRFSAVYSPSSMESKTVEVFSDWTSFRVYSGPLSGLKNKF